MSNLGYQEVIEYIVDECLAYCNGPSEIEADVDRYMEDLTAAVQSRAEQAAKEKWEQIVSATFVSIWDGGVRFESNAKVNLQDRTVEVVDPKEDNVGVEVLEREFVIVDGKEYPAVFHEDRNGFPEDEQSQMFFYN